MESARSMVCTLEELRDPQKRLEYQEGCSVKTLQKNLASAIEEARETISGFKELSSNCSQEIVSLKEGEEKDLALIIPNIQSEVERLIDSLRNEMVAQNSENVKMNKQVQGLSKEKTALQQLANEAVGKFVKAEMALQIR